MEKALNERTNCHSVFQNKELLLRLLFEESRSRDHQANMMWENLKYFTTLTSALVTASLVLLKLLFDLKSGSNSPLPPWLLSSSLVIPLFSLITSVLGYFDLKRRWSRIMDSIVHLAKLESLLGLHEKMPARVWQDDSYLFHRCRDRIIAYDSRTDFIRGETEGSNMFTHMRRMHVILAFVAIVLIPLNLALLL